MRIFVRKMTAVLFLFTFPLFLACGPDGNRHSDNGNHAGIYQASLIFPSEISSIKPDGTSSTKLINGGINCAGLGIATLTFSFFSPDNKPIAGGEWPCEAHQATITDIPAGSGITLEVTAKDESGMALLRGEERDIVIVANQTTEGDDITLYPANSPSVAAGDTPKTLEFSWEHLQFPGNADHYLLQVNPDGDSGFDAVAGAENITDTSYELTVPVHLTDWGRALYRVVAVNALREPVGTSAAIDLLTTVAAEEVIGYFKASNTESDDRFGMSVALSGDGNILAVGAQLEGSSATGINNDPDNNNAIDAGAAYLFVRNSSGDWRQQAYIKAGNTDRHDRFGWSLSLSADAQTLAVGAFVEDSAATGINGDQADNSTENAGAVYLY